MGCFEIGKNLQKNREKGTKNRKILMRKIGFSFLFKLQRQTNSRDFQKPETIRDQKKKRKSFSGRAEL